MGQNINLSRLIVILSQLITVQRAAQLLHDDEYTLAYLNVSYVDQYSRRLRWPEKDPTVGKFGQGKVASVEGVLVHVRHKFTTTRNNYTWQSYLNNGCEVNFDEENIPKGSGEAWIGLIKKGQCSITEKILNAVTNNATAVVIYDDEERPVQKIHHRVQNVVTVFISREKGERLAKLADKMSRNSNSSSSWVRLTISVGPHHVIRMNNINRTSVLFVSVSFIVLMVISLAWLIFYYIQRFRYMTIKDKLSKRLSTAAKKALTKIPLKTVKEIENDCECCAVCIEPFKLHEVLRILPCSHQFHKICVDPWLLDQRTCPMCKMDILKYFGFTYPSPETDVYSDSETTRLNVSVLERRRSMLGNMGNPSHSSNLNISNFRATGSRGSGVSTPSSNAITTSSLLHNINNISLNNNQDQRSHAAQIPAYASSVEAIKIAILENSPMIHVEGRHSVESDSNEEED